LDDGIAYMVVTFSDGKLLLSDEQELAVRPRASLDSRGGIRVRGARAAQGLAEPTGHLS
jgi:hypothetical protein